jgi:hypothetical protein
MRDPRKIDVPVRFGLYIFLGGLGVWAVHNELLLIAYATSVVALVLWYALFGKERRA